MAFTSWEFARFFAVVVVALGLLRRPTSRQILLLLASAYFYARSAPRHLALLAVPILVDYCAARAIEQSRARGARAPWLVLSLAADLGLLAYFKLAVLTGSPFQPSSLLPLGISFFTLRSLGYVIDVHRGDVAACRSLWRYALFVAYFPSLPCGPIARASSFFPQLTRSLSPSRGRAWAGAQIVLLGLTKKLVIADQLAPFTNAVFSYPSEFSPLTVASAVFAYSLEIYCDFSGYSDIAIGVSRIIGIDLPVNFDMPYLSTSLTEFWRRWHITFSSWLRDYVYIPLGGSRRGTARTCVHLFVVFLLGGLWHGVSWTFAVWGLLHAVGLTAHKLWLTSPGRRFRPLGGAGAWLLTNLFVCAAWIPFRADSIDTAVLVLRKVAGLDPGGVAWLYSPILMVTILVAIGHVIGVRRARASRLATASYASLPMPGFAGGFALTAWILLVLLFAAIETSPFLYLQF